MFWSVRRTIDGPPPPWPSGAASAHSFVASSVGVMPSVPPRPRRYAATASCLWLHASASGVPPQRSRTFTSAPCSHRYLTELSWPSLAARCSGVPVVVVGAWVQGGGSQVTEQTGSDNKHPGSQAAQYANSCATKQHGAFVAIRRRRSAELSTTCGRRSRPRSRSRRRRSWRPARPRRPSTPRCTRAWG